MPLLFGDYNLWFIGQQNNLRLVYKELMNVLRWEKPMSKDLSKKNGQILTKFTPMQLESALAYAENIMESLPIDFFVLDDLSEFLVKNSPDEWLHDLEDISIGVRKHWVTKNVLSTLETVVKDLVIIPGEWQFNSYE